MVFAKYLEILEGNLTGLFLKSGVKLGDLYFKL